MKKRFAILAICALLLALPWSVTAYAAHQYVIADLRIAATIPSGYDTFTRSMDEDSPLLEKYGTDAERVKKAMHENNLYIDAVNTQTGNHLLISGYSDGQSEALWSMQSSGEARYADEAEKAREYLQPGAEISIRNRNSVDYWYYTLAGADGELAQYTTVENGMYIQITASSAGGLQQADIDALEDVIGTVFVTEYTSQPASGNTGTGLFTIRNVGLIITAVIAGVIVLNISKRLRRQKRERRPGESAPRPVRTAPDAGTYKYHYFKPPTRDRDGDGRDRRP